MALHVLMRMRDGQRGRFKTMADFVAIKLELSGQIPPVWRGLSSKFCLSEEGVFAYSLVMKKSLLFFAIGLLGRLIPHPFNMTPTGAIALVGGSRLPKVWRWVTPFAALLISDLLLNFFHYGFAEWFKIAPFVYGSFAINILIGQWVRGPKRAPKLMGVSLLGSFQFFIFTNFGTWLVGGLYPKTMAGLVTCYGMALPFFQRTLVGDLAWCLAFYLVLEKAKEFVHGTADQAA